MLTGARDGFNTELEIRSAAIAGERLHQMGSHFPRVVENGTTAQELGEVVAHRAFNAGWPNAVSGVAKTVELGLAYARG